ncbi:hypothetical protein ES895_26965 [Bacillus sp. 007/AIA-02/001]|uniref:hypothetical protein n=1 Tax=Bacillus sp. 007/AIA-02/001 TaxID=2509009 RepID=UPI00107555F2|nr:hypothetical protein [Bacillus sp. 007/AIA-02/001]TFW48661.1 hypothetical protein ES895_26965 [Bacillus sp. 007/AIA-02/001]
MGYYVIDPETNEEIHVSKWKIKYPDQDASCEVCNTAVYVRADATPNRQDHFAHYKHSNCPTIKDGRKKYEHLHPTEKDEENAKKIKREVVANLWPIYQKCKEIMKGNQKGNQAFLYKKEFKEMIEKADEGNIWAYKGLILKYVPYVLLVNYGVFSKKDFRKRKVHFVFDSLMSNYDDLWINSKVKQNIWRVYPDEQNSVEREQIDWDTSGLEPDYFINFITEIPNEILEGKKVLS